MAKLTIEQAARGAKSIAIEDLVTLLHEYGFKVGSGRHNVTHPEFPDLFFGINLNAKEADTAVLKQAAKMCKIVHARKNPSIDHSSALPEWATIPTGYGYDFEGDTLFVFPDQCPELRHAISLKNEAALTEGLANLTLAYETYSSQFLKMAHEWGLSIDFSNGITTIKQPSLGLEWNVENWAEIYAQHTARIEQALNDKALEWEFLLENMRVTGFAIHTTSIGGRQQLHIENAQDGEVVIDLFGKHALPRAEGLERVLTIAQTLPQQAIAKPQAAVLEDALNAGQETTVGETALTNKEVPAPDSQAPTMPRASLSTEAVAYGKKLRTLCEARGLDTASLAASVQHALNTALDPKNTPVHDWGHKGLLPTNVQFDALSRLLIHGNDPLPNKGREAAGFVLAFKQARQAFSDPTTKANDPRVSRFRETYSELAKKAGYQLDSDLAIAMRDQLRGDHPELDQGINADLIQQFFDGSAVPSVGMAHTVFHALSASKTLTPNEKTELADAYHAAAGDAVRANALHHIRGVNPQKMRPPLDETIGEIIKTRHERGGFAPHTRSFTQR